MESLSAEVKAVFEMVTANNNRANEKFKCEMQQLIASTVKEVVVAEVDLAVNKALGAKLNAAVLNMQAYTDGIEEDLRASLGLASHDDDSAPPIRSPGGAAETGPDGHCSATTTRGMGNGAYQPYIPPPTRGIKVNPNSIVANSNSFGSLLNRERRATGSNHGKPPSMDFPKFSGENPKFWQAHSEDYFAMFDTDPAIWIAVAAMQFEGDAAQWLSSVQHKIASLSWQEFCVAVMLRFGKNQHQSLVRKLYRLRQTSSVAAYVWRRRFGS